MIKTVNTKNRRSLRAIVMKLVYVVLSFVALASTEQEIREEKRAKRAENAGCCAYNVFSISNKDFALKKDGWSVSLNNLVDRSIPQIAEFIVNHGLDPLSLPRIEQKLWIMRNVLKRDLRNNGIIELYSIPRRKTLVQSVRRTQRFFMQFPNSEISIQPMIYKAELVLFSGKLEYLSYLIRYGDATLAYKDRILSIEIGFEFELLKVTYDYIVKLMIFNWRGRVEVWGQNVRAKINILFDTRDYILALNKFELQIAGRITVTFDQTGVISAIKTAIANMIVPLFKNTITQIVEQKAADAIRLYLSEINRITIPPKSESVFTYQLLNRN